jgi:phosphoribosylformylglycinamidine cyclo-ligase
MVNITGHGWRKLMRASRDLSYVIDEIPEPQPVFKLIQEKSDNDDREMYGNFNMGAGFAIFMPKESVAIVQEIARNRYRLNSGQFGQIENGRRQVIIVPKNIEYKGETLGVR